MQQIPSDWLDHSARTRPDRLALAGDGRRVTYSELRARAGAIAAALSSAGAGPGDPVAIDVPAGVDHAIALHGAVLAGAVVQSLPRSGAEGVAVAPGSIRIDADIDGARRERGRGVADHPPAR